MFKSFKHASKKGLFTSLYLPLFFFLIIPFIPSNTYGAGNPQYYIEYMLFRPAPPRTVGCPPNRFWAYRDHYDCSGNFVRQESSGWGRCGLAAGWRSPRTLYVYGTCDPFPFPDSEQGGGGPGPGGGGGNGDCSGSQKFAGAPINITTGNMYHNIELFRLNVPGIPLLFNLSYNSQATYNGPLGLGWTHNYNIFIEGAQAPDSIKKIKDGDGRGIYFAVLETLGLNYSLLFEHTNLTRNPSDGTYTWQHTNGTAYSFDSTGRLTKIMDRHGRYLTFSYNDVTGLLESIISKLGQAITISYNADGRIESVADPNGNTYSFSYTGDRLTSIVFPDTTYGLLYNDQMDTNNLTGIVDGQGNVLHSWVYNNADKAIEYTKQGGVDRITIDYTDDPNKPDSQVTVTNSLGQSTVYTYYDAGGKNLIKSTEGVGCSSCGQSNRTYHYNAYGVVDEITDANGNVTRYQNYNINDDGKFRTRIEAYGTPQQKTITYTYHPDYTMLTGIRTSSVLGADKVTVYDYDNDGDGYPNEAPTLFLHQLIEKGYTRDVSGNTVPYTYTTRYTYNENGQIETIDGPRTDISDVITYTYDSAGNLSSVTDTLGHTTTYKDYDANGNVGRIVDPNGSITIYTYDGRNRKVQMTQVGAGPQGEDLVTQYVYNSSGNLDYVINPLGGKADYTYDPEDRLTSIIMRDAGGSPIDTITYTYDTEGNKTGEYIRRGGEDGEVTKYTLYEYDEYSRPWKTIRPDGTETMIGYDANGNRTSFIDERGNPTAYTYDERNRLTEVIDTMGGITSYTYDSIGSLTGVTDAKDNTTSYTNDDMGRLVMSISPDSGTTAYTYDEAGNLISKLDAKGVLTTYTYDATGRLINISFPDSTQDIAYIYDEGANAKGRLSRIIDPSGTTLYAYNRAGNTIKEDRTIGDDTYTTSYTYDRTGNIDTITYPSDRVVRYLKDSIGRVVEIETSKGGDFTAIASGFTYDPFGGVNSFDYANGISTQINRNLRYHITDITAGSVMDRRYRYDPVGNITGIIDELDAARTQGFTYDRLNRLIDASGIYGEVEYTYDPVGNRLKETRGGTTIDYQYRTGTSQIEKVIRPQGETGYVHDPNGNIINSGENIYNYNQNNRLLEAIRAGEQLSAYTYDATGKRVKKESKGVIYHYLYDLHGNHIMEICDDGEGDSTINEYIYAGNQRIAFIPGQEEVEVIPAVIDFDPDTFNLKSSGRWASVYIELPLGYDPADIEIDSIRMNGIIPAQARPFEVGDYDGDGIEDLMVKFKREDVANILAVSEEADIIVTGDVSGIPFEGVDSIRVIGKGGGKAKGFSADNGDSGRGQTLHSTVLRFKCYYYHNDHLGTPQIMTDYKGTVVWKAVYEPFGEVEIGNEQVVNNFRFPGQYFDQETGLYYNWFRYYEPGVGRYLRADPIGIAGGINLFAYVFNSPIILIDPFGLCTNSCCDNCKSEYVPTLKRTGERRQPIEWNESEMLKWQAYRALAAVATAKGGFGISRTFVIGIKYFEEEWAQFVCLIEYCLDTMETTEIGCRKKEGSEYWIVVDEKEIKRTVKGDIDLEKTLEDLK